MSANISPMQNTSLSKVHNSSDAIGSSDLLLAYSMIALALYNTIVLIITSKSICIFNL